jgi:anaerobic ribonucleoside-triphosphate reductase
MTDESTKEEVVKLDDKERQPCEIWTRVMGYFRPVSEFNVGKKSEANDRKYFSVKKTVRKLLCRD